MVTLEHPIITQFQSLSREEQEQIANLILDQLDPPDPNREAAWGAEAAQRWQAIQTGEMRTVPLEEVFGKYRK